MRVLVLFVAVVLVLAMSTLTMAQKNICAPIKTIIGGIINPAQIPAAKLTNMTNRGQGSYTLGVNLCLPTATSGSCGSGYVTISNATGCIGTFNTVMSRPTVAVDGFSAKYGSSTAAKNDAEVMVLCNPLDKNDIPLSSRSKKFANLSPNKLGGTTYMAVLFSGAACGSGGSGTTKAPNPSSDIPSFPPIPSGGSQSNIPSGSSNLPSGSSNMPSGGSSNMPSGGSQSNLPSGGSNSQQPSAGSNSQQPYYPSGGSQNSGIVPNVPPNSGTGPAPGSGSNIPIPPLPPAWI